MKRKELKKIKSNTLDRGMSLLNLTISSGSKFLGHRLANMLGDEASKEERIHEFLMHQAKPQVRNLHGDPSRFG